MGEVHRRPPSASEGGAKSGEGEGRTREQEKEKDRERKIFFSSDSRGHACAIASCPFSTPLNCTSTLKTHKGYVAYRPEPPDSDTIYRFIWWYSFQFMLHRAPILVVLEWAARSSSDEPSHDIHSDRLRTNFLEMVSPLFPGKYRRVIPLAQSFEESDQGGTNEALHPL